MTRQAAVFVSGCLQKNVFFCICLFFELQILREQHVSDVGSQPRLSCPEGIFFHFRTISNIKFAVRRVLDVRLLHGTAVLRIFNKTKCNTLY